MDHSAPGGSRRRGHLLVLILVLSLLGGLPALAAGKGKGNGLRTYEGVCWVDGNVVYGENLPGDEMTNFWITDPDGSQHGFALGTSTWWKITVPEREGPTTYQFIGIQRAKDGKKYDVFATCSAEA
jgi:hypothetical protein